MGGTEVLADDALTVRFVDERAPLEPGDTLSFGRVADLVIDEANLHMEESLGRFAWRHDMWWLENRASSCVMTLSAADGTGYNLLPGTGGPMWFGGCRVTFSAGRAKYALDCDTRPVLGDHAMGERGGDAPAPFWLTPDQRRLVAALAEPHLLDASLRHSAGWELPSSQQAAHRLGWTITAFNRKLDRLCGRLDRREVGWRRPRDGRAVDRRERLVEHALVTRVITADDLGLLDASRR